MIISIKSAAVVSWKKSVAEILNLQWLLHGLQPNYHTIADFRKEHAAPLQCMFKLYVQFLNSADLPGKKTSNHTCTKPTGSCCGFY